MTNPSMKEIFTKIAEQSGFTLAEIRGPSRTKLLTHARHAGMLEARIAGFPNTQIAQYLNRDTSTIISGIEASKTRAIPEENTMGKSEISNAYRRQQQKIRDLQQERDRLLDMLIEAEDRARRAEEKLASMEEHADVEA